MFRVADDANREAAVATIKGYYYQRSSIPLEEKHAGKWHRSTGHPDNIIYIHPSAAGLHRPSAAVISSPGGWYDAGDYNKYIVNSGITMGTLLSAFEDFRGYFKQLYTGLPESNDPVPDILDEINYNLRWMLTMQDPGDGGVYHNCTNASFDGMVMPGITKAPRYLVQKGTAATLDFAAVAAQAGRVLQKYSRQLPGFADSCMKASRKAWEWALLNPAMAYDQNAINQSHKPAIVTGAYGDRNFEDEWFWAAAELYITTRDKRYYDAALKHMKDSISLPTWSNVAMLGYYSFLRFSTNLPSASMDNITLMKKKVTLLGACSRRPESQNAG